MFFLFVSVFAPGKIFKSHYHVVVLSVVHVSVSLSSSENSLLSIEFVSKGIVSWPLIEWMLLVL